MKSILEATRRITGSLRPGGATTGRVPEAAVDTPVLEEELEPGARDVRERLLEHGASPEFTGILVRAVLQSRVRGTYAIDAAARLLAAAFPILPSPRRKKGSRASHIFVLVGPTGAGKTTTLAKLGRRLEEAGRRVLYASMDAAGASALRSGSLEADVDRTELPLVSIRGTADLSRELKRRERPDVVLVDTPGLSPRDTAGLDELAREVERLSSCGPTDVLEVLPATKSRSSIGVALSAFLATEPSGCVLTKLDETDEPLTVLEEITRADLPVAFLCDGLDTRGHLERPTPSALADLALRGRWR